MKKVFITGAEGFIGSHLVEKLVKEKFKVTAMVRYNFNNNIGKEKIIHQIATETNDNLIATVASGIPNDCGYKYISTFTINNSPPPKYPSEYPREDT